MYQQLQWMMWTMAVGKGTMVEESWEGGEQDCQTEEDGGWGPSTMPAFSAGGGWGGGTKGKGKGLDAAAPAFCPY